MFHGQLKAEDCRLEKGKFRCKACGQHRSKLYEQRNKEKVLAKYTRIRRANRLKVLQHYSKSETPFCSCCNEVLIEFLVLDHIQGGGSEHRREVGPHMYEWAINNNFPDMFRVLCNNCNMSFGVYGYCPHHPPE
jgi:hypothetical protein